MLQDFSEYGYLGVFVALIAAGFGLPIPEELPVLTAGILVGHEDTTLRWYFMLPVVIAGVVIGDGVLYGIGRLWGSKLLKLGWVQRKIIPPEQRFKIEQNFAKSGIMVLLGARMLPGIRTPIFLMAGVMRVPLKRFLLADAIYAIPLVNLLFWLAYMLTDQVLVVFVQIRKVQEEYRPLVYVAILSAIAGALIYKYLFARHVSTGEPPHVPQIISKPAEVLGHVIESAVDKVTGRHPQEKTDEQKKEIEDSVKSSEAEPLNNSPPEEVEKEKCKKDGVDGDESLQHPDGAKDQKPNDPKPTDEKEPLTPLPGPEGNKPERSS
ncbi:MAG TPA: DedA family protein [Gemmata sp.]|jgi:membrane protein DedA with SNARE-associated domain|nr:DedA family protein [Gemmata sp.]